MFPGDLEGTYVVALHRHDLPAGQRDDGRGVGVEQAEHVGDRRGRLDRPSLVLGESARPAPQELPGFDLREAKLLADAADVLRRGFARLLVVWTSTHHLGHPT